jgi:hypothetical protein
MVDSLRDQTAMDRSFMPYFNQLMSKSVHGVLQSCKDHVTSPCIQASMEGRYHRSIFSVIQNFTTNQLYQENLLLQAKQNGYALYASSHIQAYGQYQYALQKLDIWRSDQEAYDLAVKAYRSGKYDVVFLHLLHSDHVAHAYTIHGDGYRRGFRQIDQQIEQLAKMVHPEEAFLVYGDHGHAPDGSHKFGVETPSYYLMRSPIFRAGIRQDAHIKDIRFFLGALMDLPLPANYQGKVYLPLLRDPGIYPVDVSPETAFQPIPFARNPQFWMAMLLLGLGCWLWFLLQFQIETSRFLPRYYWLFSLLASAALIVGFFWSSLITVSICSLILLILLVIASIPVPKALPLATKPEQAPPEPQNTSTAPETSSGLSSEHSELVSHTSTSPPPKHTNIRDLLYNMAANPLLAVSLCLLPLLFMVWGQWLFAMRPTFHSFWWRHTMAYIFLIGCAIAYVGYFVHLRISLALLWGGAVFLLIPTVYFYGSMSMLFAVLAGFALFLFLRPIKNFCTPPLTTTAQNASHDTLAIALTANTTQAVNAQGSATCNTLNASIDNHSQPNIWDGLLEIPPRQGQPQDTDISEPYHRFPQIFLAKILAVLAWIPLLIFIYIEAESFQFTTFLGWRLFLRDNAYAVIALFVVAKLLLYRPIANRLWLWPLSLLGAVGVGLCEYYQYHHISFWFAVAVSIGWLVCGLPRWTKRPSQRAWFSRIYPLRWLLGLMALQLWLVYLHRIPVEHFIRMNIFLGIMDLLCGSVRLTGDRTLQRIAAILLAVVGYLAIFWFTLRWGLGYLEWTYTYEWMSSSKAEDLVILVSLLNLAKYILPILLVRSILKRHFPDILPAIQHRAQLWIGFKVIALLGISYGFAAIDPTTRIFDESVQQIIITLVVLLGVI